MNPSYMEADENGPTDEQIEDAEIERQIEAANDPERLAEEADENGP